MINYCVKRLEDYLSNLYKVAKKKVRTSGWERDL
jgi:hypothetical protein